MADHCLGPVLYGIKAIEATGASADAERAWQVQQLPDELCELVLSAIEKRFKRRSTERHKQR
jgi:hypothetical protein